ncbi:MAG: nucleotidyltransferase family protein [Acidimicrobiales bacterium]
MDFVRPVEAIVPGVRGRVLATLAATDAEMTMTTVARLSDVSVNRAVTILNELVHLGLVKRREAGSAALVCLARENCASRVIMALGGLANTVVDRLREAAEEIRPTPEGLILFGSFARGEADAESDIDVLALRRRGVSEDDESWLDSLGRWTTTAHQITGNAVNVIDRAVDELPPLLRTGAPLWQEIAREGRVLVGTGVSALTRRGTGQE